MPFLPSRYQIRVGTRAMERSLVTLFGIKKICRAGLLRPSPTMLDLFEVLHIFPSFLENAVALVELIPRLLCSSVKSIKIPAALCPEIRNPTVVHLSEKQLRFCHHPSSAFCWVVLQPSSAGMSTLRRIYIPFRTYTSDIGEDANSHKVTQCKYLSRSFCTAVGWTSQSGFCL